MGVPAEQLDIDFGREVLGPGNFRIARFVVFGPLAFADRESQKARRRVIPAKKELAWGLDVPMTARYLSLAWAVVAGITLGWEIALVEGAVGAVGHFLKRK